ncbi:MAG TPA: TldD/PmbA family protein [Candidatus Lustribacter sp.]|nr:TldD/PmbA family protein [Candidatus Lustribacter sp.]
MNQYAAAAARILDTAGTSGAQYADVQFWTLRQEDVGVRNGDVRNASDTSSAGYGVRVLVDGSWGFFGSDRFDDASFDAAAARATAIAKSGTKVSGRIPAVVPVEKIVAHYETPMTKDPASVSLSARADLLLSAERTGHVAKNVISGYAFMTIYTTVKEFYSTTGSVIAQTLRQAGAGCGVSALGRDQDVQTRGGPGDFGLYQGGGYEVVERANLHARMPEYGREAVILADAPALPSGTRDLILDGSVLNLLMHESIGHALELDRALGWEANFSGVSWATPDQVGKLRFGSPLLNIHADNALPLGLATVGFDDEGVKPERVPLIEDGILRAFLSSRDTAAQTNLPQTASIRAQDWASVPIVRMTNIELAPHEGTLASIVADTKDGLYVAGIRSWSIDDHRLNFQFGPQIGYEIKNGKRGRIYKQPTFTGVSPHFWGSLDRVAGPEEFVVWGTPNCGKGEPEQAGRTTHACSHARFRGATVGVKTGA